MPSEDLIRSCLYNWLGYGTPNSPVWFVGMEEGGAEIWRESASTMTLEDSLRLRASFRLAMDFAGVWEGLYGIPLENFRGSTVWHYMAAFLLSLKGEVPTTERVRAFVFRSKSIGSVGGDHFLCEFLPLPRQQHDSIVGYECVWSSADAYRREVGPRRLGLIDATIRANDRVRLLVSYDRSFTQEALNHYRASLVNEWVDDSKRRYALYGLPVTEDRSVHLLSTPFFGQGQASYANLRDAAMMVMGLF